MPSRRFLNQALLLVALSAATSLPSAASGSGSELFTDNCIRCHGEDGRGHTKMGRKLKIVDLTSPTLQARLTPGRIFDSITHGKPDASGNERMPAFGEKLSEEDRRALASYVKSFGNSPSSKK